MPTKITAAKPKPVGLGLHIGLNLVSAAHYGGWDGPLAACENDARDMAALSKTRGIKPSVLLTKQATRKAVLAALRGAAKALKAGDLFFMSFSGHGGQVRDVTGEEDDKKDETWCLWDGQLIDDELYLELAGFKAGVRVVVLSDSCHSGTVTRAGPPAMDGPTMAGARSRMMPLEVGRRTYDQHHAFYDKLQQDVAKAAGGARIADPDAALAQLATPLTSGRITTIATAIKPAVLLISGCQDNQTSMDGPHNGAFTGRLLQVWDQGRFKGSYAKFHAVIRAGMPATQSPNLFTLGPSGTLLAQQPFTL
jgi:metacaspase-1